MDGGKVNLSEFVTIPKRVFSEGQALPMDIFIYMPANNTVIHFRRKNDVLSAQDFASLMKIPAANLLIRKVDLESSMQSIGKQMAAEIKSGNIDTEGVKQTAGAMLKVLDTKSPDGTISSASDAMKSITSAATEMILELNKTPAVQAYSQILDRAKSMKDPIAAHNYQVSGLAVIMQLAVGGGSMDDLVDIGAAGLVHDAGLSDIPGDLRDRHLLGSEDSFTMTDAQKTAFMKHIDHSLAKAKQSKPPLSVGCLRMIEMHHEGFDGSGPKAMAGNQCFRPARVLRIADDATAVLLSFGNTKTLTQILTDMQKKRNEKVGAPLYDPELIKLLIEKVGI